MTKNEFVLLRLKMRQAVEDAATKAMAQAIGTPNQHAAQAKIVRTRERSLTALYEIDRMVKDVYNW